MLWAEWWAWEMNLFLAGLLCGGGGEEGIHEGSGGSGRSGNVSSPWNVSSPSSSASSLQVLGIGRSLNASSNYSSASGLGNASGAPSLDDAALYSGGGNGATCVELDVFPIVSNTSKVTPIPNP